jgi:hypothetical protein
LNLKIYRLGSGNMLLTTAIFQHCGQQNPTATQPDLD